MQNIFTVCQHCSDVYPAPDRWNEYRERYLNFFREELGIDSATEYAEYFEMDGRNEEVMAEHLNDLGRDLTSFERVYPMADQDLMVVMLNPGLHWRGDIGDRAEREIDDNYMIGSLGVDDLSRRIAISMDGISGWLSGKIDIFEKINEQTTPLTGLSSNPNRTASFFSDVYYTNWYKFATPGGGDIPSQLKDADSFISEIVRQEARELNPDLVLLFGRWPWIAFRSEVTPVRAETPSGTSITEYHGHLYSASDEIGGGYLIPHMHPSARDPLPPNHDDRIKRSLELYSETVS